MRRITIIYRTSGGSLLIYREGSIAISIYGDEPIRQAKEFLDINNASEIENRKEIPEKTWDRFLKMEY